MAHISNILRDKLFVFSGSEQTSDTENEILSLIAEKENLDKIEKSSLVDNGENYDSYKIQTKQGRFLVKVSLDKKLTLFSKEFSALEKLKELKIAPKPVAVGEIIYGDKILYLITSFEESQSVYELGKSILLFNYQDSLKLLHKIHQIKVNEPSFQTKIQEIFARTSFNNQPEFANLLKVKSDNFQMLDEELIGAKLNIQEKYKEIFAGNSLVHSNINPRTLLFGSFDMKIINWQDFCAANPMVDLSNLRMEFDLDEDFEYKLFCHYNSFDGKHSWDEYIECRNFWSAVKLLEYVFSYIKEIYLFNSMRQDKILNIFSSFCRNIKFFEHIPVFKKNKDALLELFSSPMI